MNILPKKRWHVRNQDNKERVRRDEENARLEEKKEQERIALAEKEVRISLLRKKSIPNDPSSAAVQVVDKDAHKGHINLFSVEEEAGSSGIKKDNIDYIKEKKAEKESYEKKIGLLTYVGQSSLEGKQDGKLWYTEKRATKVDSKGNDSGSEEEIEQIKKSRLDPLLVVDKHLKHKRDHKKKKKKKDKKEKEEKSSSSRKSIEQLREERVRRENAEKKRSQQFLNGLKTNSSSNNEENVSDRNRKYNSQFNPDFSRR